jgi:dihydrolipoamide dehydrogenase
MAVGRRSNADLIKAEKAGLELDKRGYIKTNELLETNIKHIYAVGDANGTQMFTHVANRESVLAVHNAMHGSRLKMDYSATPHAIYSHPQVASVGMTEEAASKEHKVLVGRAKYSEVASGEIWMDDTGFAKVIVDAGARHRILGFHVIGPHAPVVIQEVINAMASGGNIDEIHSGMHIHPALPELIVRTLGSIG